MDLFCWKSNKGLGSEFCGSHPADTRNLRLMPGVQNSSPSGYSVHPRVPGLRVFNIDSTEFTDAKQFIGFGKGQ